MKLKLFWPVLFICLLFVSAARAENKVDSNLQNGPGGPTTKPGVIYLVDKSRSVGDKNFLDVELELVQQSFSLLPPGSTVAIIAFDSAPFLIVQPTEITDETATLISSRLRRIVAAGQSNPASSIETAGDLFFEIASESKHLFVLSDGVVNSDDRLTSAIKKLSPNVRLSVAIFSDDSKLISKWNSGLNTGFSFVEADLSKFKQHFLEQFGHQIAEAKPTAQSALQGRQFEAFPPCGDNETPEKVFAQVNELNNQSKFGQMLNCFTRTEQRDLFTSTYLTCASATTPAAKTEISRLLTKYGITDPTIEGIISTMADLNPLFDELARSCQVRLSSEGISWKPIVPSGKLFDLETNTNGRSMGKWNSEQSLTLPIRFKKAAYGWLIDKFQ